MSKQDRDKWPLELARPADRRRAASVPSMLGAHRGAESFDGCNAVVMKDLHLQPVVSTSLQ